MPPATTPMGPPLTKEQLAVFARAPEFVLYDAPLTREQLTASGPGSDAAFALFRELRRNKVHPDLPGNEAPDWNSMEWPRKTDED